MQHASLFFVLTLREVVRLDFEHAEELVAVAHFDAVRQLAPVDVLVLLEGQLTRVLVFFDVALRPNQHAIFAVKVPLPHEGTMLPIDHSGIDPPNTRPVPKDRPLAAVRKSPLKPLAPSQKQPPPEIESHAKPPA